MLPELKDVLALARGAGEILRDFYDRPLTVEHKGAVDLVTESDKASEAYLLGEIRRRWPGQAILAEESGAHTGQGEALWLVDPLDGTTNFAHGPPIFSVSVAVAVGGVVQLGVGYDPLREEAFCATRGQGAWLGERRLQVGRASALVESLLVTGFPYDQGSNPDNNLNYFKHLVVRSRGMRRLGSAALDLAYVAAGRVDGYWEIRLQPWDVAAGMLLVEEAGGRVTRLNGEPDVLRQPCSVLAANPALHGLLRQEIEAVRAQAETGV